MLLARDGLFVFLGARGRPGDLARARDGSGRNAEQLERRLGWANPRTALAWSNHALLRAGAGEPAPALDRLAACAEALADRLGPDHPDGLLAAANQSALLERTGHRLEAAALRGRILPRLERLLGAKHPEVLAVRQGACVHRALELQPW
ncbi:hypothetical protein ACFQZC_16570 [Streptacidiphilus monticola]